MKLLQLFSQVTRRMLFCWRFAVTNGLPLKSSESLTHLILSSLAYLFLSYLWREEATGGKSSSLYISSLLSFRPFRNLAECFAENLYIMVRKRFLTTSLVLAILSSLSSTMLGGLSGWMCAFC